MPKFLSGAFWVGDRDGTRGRGSRSRLMAMLSLLGILSIAVMGMLGDTGTVGWSIVKDPNTGTCLARIQLNASTTMSFAIRGRPVGEATSRSQASYFDAALELVRDQTQIDWALSDSDALAVLTLSEDRGNIFTEGNILLDDYEALTPNEFIKKYGSDIYHSLVAIGLGGHEIRRLASTQRGPGELVGDFLVGAGSSLAHGVLRVTDIIWSGAPPWPVRDWVLRRNASLREAATDLSHSMQSYQANSLRYVDELRATLDGLDRLVHEVRKNGAESRC